MGSGANCAEPVIQSGLETGSTIAMVQALGGSTVNLGYRFAIGRGCAVLVTVCHRFKEFLDRRAHGGALAHIVLPAGVVLPRAFSCLG